MTPDEIKAKRAKVDKKMQRLRYEIETTRLKYKQLYLECAHPDKYDTNCMGRDPGGAHCPDCGKDW